MTGAQIEVGDVVAWADVPAYASADDLRRLAEVFEVREALPLGEPALVVALGNICGLTLDQIKDIAAKRLHAAGWRPGMTAEDAASMLAEAEAR